MECFSLLAPRNCPEWVIAELGMFSYSLVSVPLYRKLEVAITHIIAECELSVIIVQDEETARFLLQFVPPSSSLRHIVTIRDVRRTEVIRTASELGVKIVRFSDLEKCGAGRNLEAAPPEPGHLAVICYSPMMSSDLRPKGAMLSHQNLIAAASACLLQLGGKTDCRSVRAMISPADEAPRTSDLMVSYLPMCYALERCCQLALVLAGGRVGFYCGNMRGLATDLRDLRPTIVPTVPRVVNRIYDQSTRLARKNLLVRWFLNRCLTNIMQRQFAGQKSQSLWSRLVLRHFRRQFGKLCGREWGGGEVAM